VGQISITPLMWLAAAPLAVALLLILRHSLLPLNHHGVQTDVLDVIYDHVVTERPGTQLEDLFAFR
jgi:hypothetical protein